MSSNCFSHHSMASLTKSRGWAEAANGRGESQIEPPSDRRRERPCRPRPDRLRGAAVSLYPTAGFAFAAAAAAAGDDAESLPPDWWRQQQDQMFSGY